MYLQKSSSILFSIFKASFSNVYGCHVTFQFQAAPLPTKNRENGDRASNSSQFYRQSQKFSLKCSSDIMVYLHLSAQNFSKKRIAAVPIAGVAISTSPRNRALAATSVFTVCSFINILKAAKQPRNKAYSQQFFAGNKLFQELDTLCSSFEREDIALCQNASRYYNLKQKLTVSVMPLFIRILKLYSLGFTLILVVIYQSFSSLLLSTKEGDFWKVFSKKVVFSLAIIIRKDYAITHLSNIENLCYFTLVVQYTKIQQNSCGGQSQFWLSNQPKRYCNILHQSARIQRPKTCFVILLHPKADPLLPFLLQIFITQRAYKMTRPIIR